MKRLLFLLTFVGLIATAHAAPLTEPRDWRFDLDVLVLKMEIDGVNHEAVCLADYAWVPAEYFAADGLKRAKITLLDACGDFVPKPFDGQPGCSLRDPESGQCLDPDPPPCNPGGTQFGPAGCAP